MVWGVSPALKCGFSAVLQEFSPSATSRRAADLGGVREGKQLFGAMERSWLCLAQVSERAGSAGSAGCRTRQGTEGTSASATANPVRASLSEPSRLLEPRTTGGITLLIPAPRAASQSSPWKHSLSWEIWVLSSSPSFCSTLQTQAGFFFAMECKQPEYFLNMTCTWLGTGGWLVGPK